MFHGANARHSARMVNDRFPDGAMVSKWYRKRILGEHRRYQWKIYVKIESKAGFRKLHRI
jgi:hypothetical protein